MKIRTVTPVHIGTGRTVPHNMYIRLGGDTPRMARLDVDRLVAEHVDGDPARSRELATEFETLTGISNFIRSKAGNIKRSHLLYDVDIGVTLDSFFNDTTDALVHHLSEIEIHECVKSGYHAVLPGSSLKGALLTGYYWQMYDGDWAAAERDLRRGNPQQVREGLSQRLRISDTLGDAKLALENCRRIMHIKAGDHFSPLKALEVWVECLKLGQTLQADIPRRKGPPNRGGAINLTAEDVATLCAGVNAWAASVMDDDIAHMRRYHVPTRTAETVRTHVQSLADSEDTCIVRVGWGVGKAATSLGLLQGGGYQSSKSRWLLANAAIENEVSEFGGGLAGPLGWVRVQFEQTDYVS